MIVLNLMCSGGHGFEGWFGALEVYTNQLAKGLVECPHCGDKTIVRLPNSPRIRRPAVPQAVELDETLHAGSVQQTLARLAAKAEDVGEQFSEEARRIHYGEARLRNIRGQATVSEALELMDEGIAVLPAPSFLKESKH